MNSSDVIRELQRRYANTYFRWRRKIDGVETPWEVVHCRDVSSQSNGTFLVLNSPSRGELIYSLHSPDQEVSFQFPRVGTFQFAGASWLFTRLPARQWQRGLSFGNSLCTPIGMSALWTGPRVSSPVLQAAFNKFQYSFSDGLHLLKETRESSLVASVALFGDFTLSHTLSKERPFKLYYLSGEVCDLNPDGSVAAGNSLFKKEVQSLGVAWEK